MLALLEAGECVLRLGEDLRRGIDDCNAHQIDELMRQNRVVDFKNLIVFRGREGATQEFAPNAILQRFFNFQIPRQLRFDRAGHIGQVGFAAIVEQTSQLHKFGIAAGFGFHSAIDAVLAYGVETLEVTVGAAKHGKGVGNICNVDQLCVGMQGVEHDVGMCHNFTHFLFLLIDILIAAYIILGLSVSRNYQSDRKSPLLLSMVLDIMNTC